MSVEAGPGVAAVSPPLLQADLALTGRCNLRCHYCYYADEMVALRDLPTSAWQAFFGELGRLAVRRVTLTGGEVFTRKDFFDLVDGVVSNRMRYGILTNGTLVDEALVARFETGKRRLRLDAIQVSIDGSRAGVHDRSRPHSFDRALRGLRLLQAAGLPVTVRTTINRHNLHDLEEVAGLLLEDVGIRSFGTNSAMPMGAGCANQGEVGLTAAEKREAMAILARLQARYPGRLTAAAGPQVTRGMYAEMEHARRTGEKTARWRMGRLSACGCVFSRIAVLHDGTLVPCHILHALPLGNVATDSLATVWRDHPTLLALRARGEIPMSRVPGCEGCEWADYCNGSCPGLAQEMTGDFNRANPDDCYRRFLEECPDGVPPGPERAAGTAPAEARRMPLA